MKTAPSVIPSTAIPKAKLRKQLHQSGVEMLMKCGVQFEFRYIKGKKRPPSSFLIAGKATDRSVGMDLDHKIDHDVLAQESDLLDAARDVVENYPDKEHLELEKDEREARLSVTQVLDNTKAKVVRLAKAHHGVIAPQIQPYATARKFSVDLDGFLRERARALHEEAELQDSSRARRVLHEQARLLNVAARNGLDFVGEQDIVERFLAVSEEQELERLTIRDTKTSKKTPNESAAHESDQLTFYSLASSVVDGKIPDAVKLDYLVDLKMSTKTLTLESKRTQDQLDISLERLANAVATIESGMFVPAPQQAWWCDERYCGYARQCPYYRKTKAMSIAKELKGTSGKLVQITAEQAE